MNNLFITVSANGILWNSTILESHEIDLCEHSTFEAICEALTEVAQEDDENANPINTFDVDDWQEVPKCFQDDSDQLDLSELADNYQSSSYDLEVFEAANECDVQLSDIDEAYNGKFDSDEDFAQDRAESCGDLQKNPSWPYTCIDWEYAAKELMYDYSESNGHYFRNL